MVITMDLGKYASIQPSYPVRHRKKVPFHPRLKMPANFSERTRQIQILEAELSRFILRPADFRDSISSAYATNIHRSVALEGNPLSEEQVQKITRDSLDGKALSPPKRTLKGPTQEILNHLGVWIQPGMLAAPWTIETIRQAHSFLLGGVEEKEKVGRIRGPENVPSSVVSSTGQELFITAPAGHIEEELKSLLEWLGATAEALFPVVAAAVFFHEFESIHPFEDGNGRVGRTLFHAFLQRHGLPNSHLCSIEAELLKDPELYYRVLNWTDANGDYAVLIDFFMDAVLASYAAAHARMLKKDLLSSDLDEVGKRILVKAREHQSWFSVAGARSWVATRSEQTIRTHLAKLVSLGALEERGSTRAKRYRFAEPWRAALSDATHEGEAIPRSLFAAQAADPFVGEVFRVWIRPELERRQKAGQAAPEEGHVYKVLITLRRDEGVHVLLNDEVGLPGTAVAARPITAGQLLTLDDVRDIVSVEAPRIGGRPACYVLMFLRPSLAYVFNFGPNLREFSQEEWKAEGKRLAEFFAITTFEGSLGSLDAANRLLLPHGWWVMQAAIPQPLRKAVAAAERGLPKTQIDELFVRHFGAERLRRMVAEWEETPEMKPRSRVLREGVESYLEGKYAVSIPALLPQIEGLLKTWLRPRARSKTNGVGGMAARLGEFQSDARTGYVTKKTLGALLEALKSLGVYGSFNWDEAGGVTLNRHKILHGKEGDYWNAPNNLRVILLLDSVFRQIRYRG